MNRILRSLSWAAGIFAIAAFGLALGSVAQEHDKSIGSVPRGTGTAVQAEQADVPYFAIPMSIEGSGASYEIHFVQTFDEIYVPVAVRKPEGEGPFPAILMGSGNGNRGVSKLERAMWRAEPMIDRMIARGYVVAFGNYRNEIPFRYNDTDGAENILDDISGGTRTLKSTASLDSDDYVSLIRHLQALSFVDAKGVGTIGVSHSGELMHKAAAVIDFGAAVPIEGAVHEFLAVDTNKAPRDGRTLQLQDVDVVKSLANKEKAMARIREINTPFLHMGRDGDHLQGLFKVTHEWMTEAGKETTWVSFDHHIHGYGFHYRNDDGSYTPDEIQQEAFEIWMAFFDKHLKRTETAATEPK